MIGAGVAPRMGRWLLAVALLVGVILLALRLGDARDFARIAERAEPWWLGVAVLCQIATYVAAGQVFRAVLGAAGHALSIAAACRLSLVKLFVDQALPSGGLSGTTVLARELEQRGVPRPVVASSVAIDLASFYTAYVTGLALALAAASLAGEDSAVVVVASCLFFPFAIGLSVLVLSLSRGRGAKVAGWLQRIRPLRPAIEFLAGADPALSRRRGLFLRACGCQLVIVLCDAATVWILVRAFGARATPGGVFVSFMLSSLLRTVGFMPGGLGIFEAASVATLHMAGVPAAAALAATLVYRGLSFWLPMLPGLWLSRRAMRSPRRGT